MGENNCFMRIPLEILSPFLIEHTLPSLQRYSKDSIKLEAMFLLTLTPLKLLWDFQLNNEFFKIVLHI